MLKKSLIIIFLVLLLDQGSKIWIKTNMYLGQEFNIIGDWFIIHFTENNGMAFGMEFAGEYGKLFLSVFRIFAISLIGWYLLRLIKEKANPKLIVSMSFVFSGALGNILDSIFYGVVFGDSYNQVASFLPADGGYSKFLYGKVVDMLYFPLVEGYFPEWLPFWGGEFFMFFRPVFNVADSAITIGVAIIIIFQSSIFEKKKPDNTEQQLES
jgi:signal peptidase II